MAWLYLCRGLPASGKSTFTRNLVNSSGGALKRICKDDLRLMMDGHHGYGLRDEDFNTNLTHQLIRHSLTSGFSVILDETMVRAKDLRAVCEMYAFFSGPRNTVFLYDFTDVPFDVCVERDFRRTPPLGLAVMSGYKNVLDREGTTRDLVEDIHYDFGVHIEILRPPALEVP